MPGAGAVRWSNAVAYGSIRRALLLSALATRAAAQWGAEADAYPIAAADAADAAFPLVGAAATACKVDPKAPLACQTLACNAAATIRPSKCVCDNSHYGMNCSTAIDPKSEVADGFCKRVHKWEIPGLGTTYYSAISALFLFCSFIWILRANNKNMRLAIAGDTSGKVITISWYTKIMDAAMIWAIGWSVYRFFSVDHSLSLIHI